VLHVPEEMGPGDGEAAVLCGVLVQDRSGWVLVSGSLLTVPKDVAAMSQCEWREVQPHAKARMDHVGGIEPGATFCEEPFVTALRAEDVPAASRGSRRDWPDSSADCSADLESGGKACTSWLGGVVWRSTVAALKG